MNSRQSECLETIRTIYSQQKYMYDHHTHTVPNRIVSVSQPFIIPIVRGKAAKPVEFGAKLDLSVADGWTRLECFSFDAYNEAINLKKITKRFLKREGHYPSRILADKIYRNRENLRYCKERGIRLSGPVMGLGTAKLRETAAHVIAMSVLVLNLRKIQRAFWQLLDFLLDVFRLGYELGVVQ